MYAIFFDYMNKTYRLPVNPEEITVTSAQAIEKYEVLKLGQIAVPTHMELKEYSFTCELPKEVYRYVETPNKFKDADYYLKLFEKIRKRGDPVRFIASNGIGEDINTLVLIEELEVIEIAGEEGDKYVSFSLLEYREYGKKVMIIKNENGTSKKKTSSNEITNSKSTGTYIVKKGDSLWAIAKRYYGDGTKCNIIYNANKALIKNPSLLKIGWKLKIPSESEFAKYNSPLPSTKSSSAVKRVVPKYSPVVTNKNSSGSSGYNSSGHRGGVSPDGHSHSTSKGSFDIRTVINSTKRRSFNITKESH